MRFENEISKAFEDARNAANSLVDESTDDTVTLALMLTTVSKAIEDSFLVISRQIDRLAADPTV